MVLVAGVIGLGGGFAAVGFRRLIELGNWVAWRENATYTLDYIRSAAVRLVDRCWPRRWAASCCAR